MKRVVSGMRASGQLHIGHLFGAIRNFIELSERYETLLFVATWHGLTTEYQSPAMIGTHAYETVVDWLACGVDPNRATLFLQHEVPEHAELHLLLSMITPLSWLERVPTYKEQQEALQEKEINTYGFLGYPLLQAADIALYRAELVPVGHDQLPHIELAREIVRRFHFLYGPHLKEPEALLAEHPKVPGLDGRKMSKSYRNTITLAEDEASIRKRVRAAVTDPQRVRRNDPGNPDVCPIYGLHKLYQSHETLQIIDSGCRAATIGCVDCKNMLLEPMLVQLAPIREKREALMASPHNIRSILGDGAQKARRIANETMQDVRAAMGLSLPMLVQK